MTRQTLTRPHSIIPAIVAALFLFFLSVISASGQVRPVARSSADLPVQSYRVFDSLSGVLRDSVLLAALQTDVQAHILEDLFRFEILDSTLLKSYYRDLADISFYKNDYPRALQYYDLQKSLETKPAAIVTSSLIKRSQIMAGDPSALDYLEKFRAALVANLSSIQFVTAESSLQRIRGQYKNVTAAEIIQMAGGDLRASMAKGSVNREDAGYILFLAYEMPLFDRIAPVISSVMDSLVNANAGKVADIWPARDVRLPEGKNFKPVVLCVFDLGTDISLFKDRLYTNTNEKKDGIDNDHNGFIDDVHGVAFDIRENNVEPLLKPWSTEDTRLLPVRLQLMKGLSDLQASRNSPEAAMLRDTMATLDASGKQQLRAILGEMNDYSHGTHVAGIAMDGNPYARLMTVRVSADVGFVKEGKGASVEVEQKVASNLKKLVAYWKKANVRVVTMSWGFFVSDYENDLKEFHPEMGEADIKKMAVKLWNMRKESLYNAFRMAPGILFIASNGNKNSNSDLDLRYPAALDLPNMIGVGSVNAAGQETSFTATGSKVKVHANGFQVESYAPGGTRFLMSGTSMATPYIANLAAKLFAVDPSLTSLEVRNLILDGADKSADGKVKLANPKKSFELLAGLHAAKQHK